LYVDSLDEFFVMTVAAVTLLAAVGSASYVAAQEDDGERSGFQVRPYFSFFGLFATLMLAALETGNPGCYSFWSRRARWPARPWSG
jgi:hydrogenase-4 component F